MGRERDTPHAGEWEQALPPPGCPWPGPAEGPPHEALPGDVAVHAIGLVQPDAVVQRLARLLAPDELDRAARFATDALRRRFLVAHGVVRVLLGARAGCDPRELRFDSSGEVRGKPRLRDPPATRALAFNLSHAGELALLAITDGAEVGVDVEQVRPLDELWSVAQIVFTAAEIRALRARSAERLTEEFHRTWTRKESALKAIGKGFGIDARSVELLAPDHLPVATTGEFASEVRGRSWCVDAWEPAPGYVGALAVLAAAARTRLTRWPR